ncbi:hypothetical protein ACLOJK_029164 [Asimina triloba]
MSQRPPHYHQINSSSSIDAGLLFRQKMLYLQHHLNLDATKALTLNPDIRSAPISTLHSAETCLLSFGIPPSHFPRIFGMHPILLTSSPHAYLYPVFDFLLNEAHIPFPDLPKSVCRCPRLLVSSVPLQLRPTLHFLRGLGFGGGHRAISSLITTLLVSSIDSTLIPKLDYIQSLGFSYDEAVHMVRRSPALLTLSIQNNFCPKVDYFLNHMNGDIQQLKDFPHFFCFSLHRKIIPRHRRLLEHGLSMRLEDMLTVSDGEFRERLIEMWLQKFDKTLQSWKKITLKSQNCIHVPWRCLVFFVLNALIWGEKSSGAVPFGTMFALVFLWFGISVPLVFVGGYIGFKKPPIEDPVKTNKIPRQIPEQAWYVNPVFSILIGGILPFGAVFMELFFILTSIWLNQFYYIFGFLFIVFLILIVTCAEITIVLCYFQLCSEDYLWWWRAYLISGSSALYLFPYATFYFFKKHEITTPVSGMLYFGHMLIVSYAFFVLTGTIGFYACFWFTRLIYSSVKID